MDWGLSALCVTNDGYCDGRPEDHHVRPAQVDESDTTTLHADVRVRYLIATRRQSMKAKDSSSTNRHHIIFKPAR
jgi:hypothetical protein